MRLTALDLIRFDFLELSTSQGVCAVPIQPAFQPIAIVKLSYKEEKGISDHELITKCLIPRCVLVETDSTLPFFSVRTYKPHP
jgi:hypothetical protein